MNSDNDLQIAGDILEVPHLLQPPREHPATNRMAIGTALLAFAACGVVHVSAGIPEPPDGADAMRAGGGIIGFLASSPLEAAVSVYGTIPLLLLLGIFGLLVLTAGDDVVRLAPPLTIRADEVAEALSTLDTAIRICCYGAA